MFRNKKKAERPAHRRAVIGKDMTPSSNSKKCVDNNIEQTWVESAHVWSRQSTLLTNVTNEITLDTFVYHVHCRLHTSDDYTTDYSRSA
jgi:hypothetical protein